MTIGIILLYYYYLRLHMISYWLFIVLYYIVLQYLLGRTVLTLCYCSTRFKYSIFADVRSRMRCTPLR